MNKIAAITVKQTIRRLSAIALASIVMCGMSAGVSADEADAKRLLKAMTDYQVAQKTLSFEYDATLEVVTSDDQILALASSGAVTLNRPDKIVVTRTGGFADVEVFYNGKTLTVLGKNLNAYVQKDLPGNIHDVIVGLESQTR